MKNYCQHRLFVHASVAALGKFAASQRTGEFAGTSHSQSLVDIEKKCQTNVENALLKLN